MAKITLTRNNVLAIRAFVKANKCDWYVAKDQGAYVGTNKGDKNVLFYFDGCDPRTDGDWYDTCRRKFGGDDFGDILSPDILEQVAAMPNVSSIIIEVTKDALVVRYLE